MEQVEASWSSGSSIPTLPSYWSFALSLSWDASLPNRPSWVIKPIRPWPFSSCGLPSFGWPWSKVDKEPLLVWVLSSASCIKNPIPMPIDAFLSSTRATTWTAICWAVNSWSFWLSLPWKPPELLEKPNCGDSPSGSSICFVFPVLPWFCSLVWRDNWTRKSMDVTACWITVSTFFYIYWFWKQPPPAHSLTYSI